MRAPPIEVLYERVALIEELYEPMKVLLAKNRTFTYYNLLEIMDNDGPAFTVNYNDYETVGKSLENVEYVTLETPFDYPLIFSDGEMGFRLKTKGVKNAK